MKTIDLKCIICNCTFTKEFREYKRRIKLGKSKFYCSLTCSGKREDNIHILKRIGKSYRFKGGENKIISERGKLLRSMKEFSRRIRRRKHFEFEIAAETLLDIWEKQNGICPYTKVKLALPFTQEYELANKNYKASIDRIDSSKPYSDQNVQFVSISLNHLKSDMNEDELFEFFELIKKDLAI